MAGPGYGSGAGRWIGAKTIKVPLRPDYSHDVEAMIKADPNAGAFYVCNPNNPTGTLTPRKDLEYILANKPKDAVLMSTRRTFISPAWRIRPSTWCARQRRGGAADLLEDLRDGGTARRCGLRTAGSGGQSARVRRRRASCR